MSAEEPDNTIEGEPYVQVASPGGPSIPSSPLPRPPSVAAPAVRPDARNVLLNAASPAPVPVVVVQPQPQASAASVVVSRLVAAIITAGGGGGADEVSRVMTIVNSWSDANKQKLLEAYREVVSQASAVVEEKHERLTSDEETQSTVTILSNCKTDEEREKKAKVLLDSYHALIDIHSLTDLFRTPSRTPIPPAAPMPGEAKSEERPPVIAVAALAAVDGKRVEVNEELEEFDGFAVLVKPDCGFEAKGPVTRAIRVAVQGNYNKGKTFVLNKLAGIDLREGYTHHTRGISMHVVKKTRETPAMVLFDSAGRNTSVVWNEANVQNKRSTDAFIRELLHRVADVKLIVTGRLTSDDQQYLNELVKKLDDEKRTRRADHGSTDRPILVHNFSDLTTVAQVEGVIKREIIDIFGAEEQDAAEDEKWYQSKEFDHFVLAREGTAAGRHYNPIAVSLLRSHLRGCTNHPVNTVLNDIRKESQQLLRSYLIEDNGETLVHSTILRKINLAGDARVDEREVKLDGTLELGEQVYGGSLNRMYRRFVLHATNASGERPALMLSPYISVQKYGSVFVNEKAFEPRIDVQCSANGNRVVITLDIPGGSVKMTRRGQILMFTGERKRDVNTNQYKDGGKGQVLVERLFGKYEYSVTLPSDWDIVTASERTASGVYTIDLCHPGALKAVQQQLELETAKRRVDDVDQLGHEVKMEMDRLQSDKIIAAQQLVDAIQRHDDDIKQHGELIAAKDRALVAAEHERRLAVDRAAAQLREVTAAKDMTAAQVADLMRRHDEDAKLSSSVRDELARAQERLVAADEATAKLITELTQRHEDEKKAMEEELSRALHSYQKRFEDTVLASPALPSSPPPNKHKKGSGSGAAAATVDAYGTPPPIGSVEWAEAAAAAAAIAKSKWSPSSCPASPAAAPANDWGKSKSKQRGGKAK